MPVSTDVPWQHLERCRTALEEAIASGTAGANALADRERACDQAYRLWKVALGLANPEATSPKPSHGTRSRRR